MITIAYDKTKKHCQLVFQVIERMVHYLNPTICIKTIYDDKLPIDIKINCNKKIPVIIIEKQKPTVCISLNESGLCYKLCENLKKLVLSLNNSTISNCDEKSYPFITCNTHLRFSYISKQYFLNENIICIINNKIFKCNQENNKEKIDNIENNDNLIKNIHNTHTICIFIKHELLKSLPSTYLHILIAVDMKYQYSENLDCKFYTDIRDHDVPKCMPYYAQEHNALNYAKNKKKFFNDITATKKEHIQRKRDKNKYNSLLIIEEKNINSIIIFNLTNFINSNLINKNTKYSNINENLNYKTECLEVINILKRKNISRNKIIEILNKDEKYHKCLEFL